MDFFKFFRIIAFSLSTLISLSIFANDDECDRLVAQVLKRHEGLEVKPLAKPPTKVSAKEDALFLPGDWVVLKQGKNESQEIIDLIINSEKLLGRVQRDKRGRYFIQAINQGRRVRFSMAQSKGLDDGLYVHFKVDKSSIQKGTPKAVVVETLGHLLDEETLHRHTLSQNGVSTVHSKRPLKQAEELKAQAKNLDQIVETEITNGRRDLRKLPLRSIDNVTTVDYDDMIYVAKHDAGYTMYVAVSDVAHWVDKDTPLGKEASYKNLTHYFETTRYPLYPEKLERVFSLMPKKDRMALIVQIELNASGERIHHQIYEAVVNNQRAWNYDEVQPMWSQYTSGVDTPFHYEFELYELLHQRRKERGASYFGKKSAEFNNVNPRDLLPYSKQEESHELIAEMMIETNEAVGEWMQAQGLRGIYRAHDLIDAEKLESIKSLATFLKVGLFDQDTELTEILQSTMDPKQHEILINYVLRHTPAAYYTPKLDGHNTLASKTYMQFTSPIRRDSDTINHRIIKSHLRGEESPYSDDELYFKSDFATVKIILQKRRERLQNFRDNMDKLIRSGKKHFKADVYYVAKDFVNLRIEEFDLDISLNGKELMRKGFEMDEGQFSFKSREGGITLGKSVNVTFNKWDEFLGQAEFWPNFK
jgi:ribonuclease R